MIDIGVLTLLVLFVLVMLIRSIIRLVKFVKQRENLVYPIVALVVWTVLLLPMIFFEFRHQLASVVATDVTREVSGVDEATANCRRRLLDSFDLRYFGYAGWVSMNKQHTSQLRTDTCADFGDWLMSDKSHASDQQLTAIEVVIHEARHVGGQMDEALTECEAMDAFEAVAIRLGADKAEAARMIDVYRANIHPRLPDQYHTDCSAIDADD